MRYVSAVQCLFAVKRLSVLGHLSSYNIYYSEMRVDVVSEVIMDVQVPRVEMLPPICP
jgi:hypothetical protein